MEKFNECVAPRRVRSIRPLNEGQAGGVVVDHADEQRFHPLPRDGQRNLH